MTRMKIIYVALFLSLISCQPEGRIYSDYEPLSPNLEWLKNDARSFSVPIEDITQNYDMSIGFRYAEGYQYNDLHLEIVEVSPSGVERKIASEVKVKTDKGDYIGEPGLDIWDLDQVIETGITFKEKGTYTYTITHTMTRDKLHFAMELGLLMDKSK